MTSRAGALVPDLQRCIDSNRDLVEQLYVLFQIDGRHLSLQDHRQMLKHCRYILDFLFSSISNAGQTLSQHDIEQFSQMLRRCQIDQDLVSERLLQIEKLPAFAAVLSAVPKGKRTWVSIHPQKSYFLTHWLNEAPVVLSSRDEEGSYKPMNQGQQQRHAREREDPPDTPKGSKSMDPSMQAAASGIFKAPLSESQAPNLARYVAPCPNPEPIFKKSPAGLPLLDNEVQQQNEASAGGPYVESNNSTRSNSTMEKSAPRSEAPQSATVESPNAAQSTSSHGKKRKRYRKRPKKTSSTGESTSQGETLESATIPLPDATQCTAPPKKKPRRRESNGGRLPERPEAMKTIPTIVDPDITANVSKPPLSEETDDSGTSRPLKRIRVDDPAHLQQGQGQNEEPGLQDPVLSSPLRRYQGKKHLSQAELDSLKAYTLDLLRDLQAEEGQGAPVNIMRRSDDLPARQIIRIVHLDFNGAAGFEHAGAGRHQIETDAEILRFKLVGRAFRTFEVLNQGLVGQYTLNDGAFMPQSPPPPVHMLYEGFEKFGKELTIFEETMGKIADDDWEVPAKRQKTRRGDDLEDEGCPRVPDPGPPFTLIEHGFSTLHRTFDIFESFMHSQSHSEGEVVVAPAKPVHVQSKILFVAKAPENVQVEDQAPTNESSSKEENHPEEKVVKTIAKALSAPENQSRTVETPLEEEMPASHSTAKEDVPKGKRGTIGTMAPASLADNRQSQRMLTPQPWRKHAAGGQDSGQDDMLPPAKRRAVFDQEPHSRRAAPVYAHREQGSHERPVREQGSQRPWRENSGYFPLIG
ncbi:MAG: hypothetical protein Q9195_002921 [Heterodermia aff. obscurata]